MKIQKRANHIVLGLYLNFLFEQHAFSQYISHCSFQFGHAINIAYNSHYIFVNYLQKKVSKKIDKKSSLENEMISPMPDNALTPLMEWKSLYIPTNYNRMRIPHALYERIKLLELR